jgi:hypothetical protein
MKNQVRESLTGEEKEQSLCLVGLARQTEIKRVSFAV